MTCDRCLTDATVGEHGVFLCPLEPRRMGATIVDDTLPGGAQWIHNMSREPIWVETKTQWRAEMKKHGVVHVDSHVGVPGTDKSPVTRRWF